MIAILDYLNRSYTEEMLNRFLSYVKIDTQSNRHADKTPTTEGQWDLAHKLEQELLELGNALALWLTWTLQAMFQEAEYSRVSSRITMVRQ